MTLPPKSSFDPQFAITERGDKPSQIFRDFLSKLDAIVSAFTTSGNTTLTNAANDAAAAAAGVQIGQLYRNGSVIMVRVV